MADKLSERLEALAALRRAAPLHSEAATEAAWLEEAAELARMVEDAPAVEIDSEAGEDVRLIAEGGPLDRMTTSVRVIGMHGQRVRTKRQAVAWATQREAELVGARLPDHTLAEALQRFADEKCPGRKGARWEVARPHGRHAPVVVEQARPLGTIVPSVAVGEHADRIRAAVAQEETSAARGGRAWTPRVGAARCWLSELSGVAG